MTTSIAGVVLGLVLLGSFPAAITEAPLPPPPKQAPVVHHSTLSQVLDETLVKRSIERYSADLGLPRAKQEQLLATLKCESQYNATAVGDGGTSLGIAQIHLPAHQEITKQEAFDAQFSIAWTVQQFAAGREAMWSCYNLTYGK